MIKENTLPKIFEEDDKEKKKKKKKKKDKSNELDFDELDYIVDMDTENLSFLKLHRNLAMLGVKNNSFFLALYDESLQGVDPYDPDLDLETKLRIIAECQKNPWYFFRECVQIAVAGAPVGSGKRFEFHRGNLAMVWCALNHFNQYTELPRQNYKSVTADCLLLWLYNFGTTNSEMMLMNKAHDDAKTNLKRIVEIRNALPEYLRFDWKYNAEGKELKVSNPKESMINEKTKNSLVTKPSATSMEAADKLGRGCTQPVQWYDEISFLKFNMTIYESATYANAQASLEAAHYHKPYFKMMTSTPGDLTTKTGKDMLKFVENCLLFKEEYYDWSPKAVRALLDTSTTGFFRIRFSYKQLGRSQSWFTKQVQEVAGNFEKVRREILLEWSDFSQDSPFSAKDIEELKAVRLPIVRTLYINNVWQLELFRENHLDLTYPYILACDVSAATGNDNSTIVLYNTHTKEIDAAFHNNTIDSKRFSRLIYTIATKVLRRKCLIIIERNNVGHAILTNLADTDICNLLYEEAGTDDDALKERYKDGRKQQSNSVIYKKGFWTTDARRTKMYEDLISTVRDYKRRIAIDCMVDELLGLRKKNGRIDHSDSTHDDIIFAYMIADYAYKYLPLSRYGITVYPDLNPEKDDIDRYQLEKIEKEKHAQDEVKKMIEKEEMERLGFKEMKTEKDFYDEMDKEREACDKVLQSGAGYFNRINQYGVSSNPNMDDGSVIGGSFDQSFNLSQNINIGGIDIGQNNNGMSDDDAISQLTGGII